MVEAQVASRSCDNINVQHMSFLCLCFLQVSPFLLQLVLQPDMWLRSYCGEVKLAGLMVEAFGFTGDMAE